MSAPALSLEKEAAPLAPPERPWMHAQILLAIVLVWMLSGIYLVAPDEQAVATIFGKVAAPRVPPGLHYALPWPIENVAKLKVRQLQRVIIGGDTADRELGRAPAAQFITGDQNVIQLRVAVQFSVGTPVDYLFQTQAPAQLVAAAAESELAREIAHRDVDSVLTTAKGPIQESVRAAAQRRLNDLRSGVAISTVNIETAAPPPETAAAFRNVAGARADAARIVSDAQGYANDLIPKARGEARQMLDEAAAYREKKINESLGDAARFNQVAAEYAKAAQVTRHRLYMEAMEQVLPKIRKLIVDQNGNLDLTILRKGDSK